MFKKEVVETLPEVWAACGVIVDIGFLGWFVATGLRLVVKQPDSRGILCFFVAIVSAVTEFDVYPVG